MMNKTKLMAMCLMVSMCSLTFVACGDSDDGQGTGTNDSPALSSSDTKKELESIAKELMDKVSASDFENISDITDKLEDNDDDAVTSWFDDCVEVCKLSGSTDEHLKYLYAAANFTGKFELSNGRWKKTGDADYLQFTLNDKNGKTCVLKAETSGKLTTVHHDAFDEEDYYYSYRNEYETITERSFVIPENIHVTLTQGSSTVADVTVKTSVSIASGDFDYTRDNAQVTVAATINSYKLNVSKVAFNAGTSASVAATLSKGGEMLVECTASATGQLYSEESDKDPVGKTGQFEVKVLSNRLYVVGNISNISDLAENLNNAEDNDDNEAAFKRYVENANNLMDINVYFNGSTNSSAKLMLYPMSERYYYSNYEYWEYKPYIKFNDDTKYSFEEYFDEDTYSEVISRFEHLIDAFVDLFD